MSMIINPFRYDRGYPVPYSAAYDEGARELSFTPGAGEDQIFTIGFWFKSSDVKASGCIFHAGTSSSNVTNITLDSNARIHFGVYHTSAFQCRKTLERRFRDTAQWYHLLIAVDTTQAVQADRLKFYVNGVQDTDYNTDATDVNFELNETTHVNTAVTHKWGRYVNSGTDFHGLLAEYFIVEGLQLTPDDVMKTNATTPQSKIPIDISGLSFGSEGSLLRSAGSGALGDDTSGNTNDWTNSGVTQTIDTPTLNYCTWNPYHFDNVVTGHLSNNNLTMSNSGNNVCFSTMAATGKQYAELNCSAFSALGESTRQAFGIALYNVAGQTYMSNGTGCYGISLPSGGVIDNGSAGIDYGAMTAGETCCIALDADVGKMWIRYDDGSWLGGGDPVAGTSPTLMFPTIGRFLWATFCYNASDTNTVDFGQNGYEFAPPIGFLTVSSDNIPEPAILDPSDHHSVQVVSKAGSTTDFTVPSWLATHEWLCFIKNTTGAVEDWYVIDSLRGVNQYFVLAHDTVSQEVTDANVFSFSGTTGTLRSTLTSGKNYLIEFHKAGAIGDTAANTDGTINTTATSVNTVSGFSLSKYTPSTSAAGTVGHGQSVAPEFCIVNSMNGGEPIAYHKGLTSASYFLYLNLANVQSSNTAMWNGTAPTTSVISVGSNFGTSGVERVLYSWHSVEGYSFIGTYEGNGSANGAFVNSGMYGGHILVRNIDLGSSWQNRYTALSPTNAVADGLLYDGTNISGSNPVDIVSNGLKTRTTGSTENGNGQTHMFVQIGGTPMQKINGK